ncbi:MAG: sulfotransferase domain-containing protein [Bacteroidetes bacterium]|nr:sulfotransferase domain-containing protein [Bacteroidota bacterium]
MKVSFLIVGAQKSGTSALSYFLTHHPNIFIPPQKELHFFDNEKIYKTTQVDYNQYHDYFQPKEQQIIMGEATPIYMYWKPAARRIHEYNPDMKLIYILRNPIDRAYSNYVMEIKRNQEFLPFKLALFFEPIRRLLAFPLQTRTYSYCNRGFYTKCIKRMLNFFPSSQMLFLKTEDLLLDHLQTLKKIFEFLEIPEYDNIEQKTIFPNDYLPMKKFDRQVLRKIYLKEIEELERMLSWDLSDWKK